jgi:hypothetical protein
MATQQVQTLADLHRQFNELWAFESDYKAFYTGFDHGVGHPLLLLYDAKAPNCRKNKAFKGLVIILSGRKWPTP